MGKKKMRWTEDESRSSSSSSSDDISTEETTNRRRRSEARRTNRKKEGKVISILTELKEEMCKQSKKFSENKDETSEIRKLLEKLTENHSDQSKRLEKLTESYNDLRKQLELHTNKGTSGDDSAASRSQSYHMQPPRYRLEFRSGVIDKIEKGQSIEISVALVDCNNNQTVETGSLASATVELVVVNAEFNQHDNQYNWSREDFERNIKKARQGNLATGDVDQSVKSIVSSGRFNLVHGVKCHSGSKIFSNSSNKKVRLGVMVVLPTEERVLEGLSNPFFVRGHDRPNRQCRLPGSTSNRQGLHNGCQEQNGPMPYMQNPSWLNSIQVIDEPLASDYFMDLNAVESNFFRTPGNIGHELSSALVDIGRGQNFVGDDHVPDHAIGPEFNMNQTTCPVHLVWDRPNVKPRKRHWNLLDQLMPLYSCQRKWNEFVLPTMRLTSEKTRRRGGVLIEPLEVDDSDAERPLKRRLHRKYRLRFVSKVCKAYYTMDQIKTDDGNHIKVALFDENNTKITSGPLSSASVEVVVLHGDFNDDGQDYWTSEEFKRCVICPQPGKVESVLGGHSILVLDDGEACLGDAFFQVTSFLARTGKFKMGVTLASTQDERIQEGISEPFLVKARRVGGLPPGFRSHPTDEELIHPCTGQPIAEASNREAAAMSEVSVLNQGGEEESPLVLPPGFRFHPTDAEVVVDYLTPKALDSCFTCVVVADVNLHKVEPWDLLGKAKMGEKEWYFFNHKDRKYLTGTHTKRATENGYWKATGKDKEIFRNRVVVVGMKKTLVFYIGRAPCGKKTPWVMHEYRLDGELPPNLPRTAKDEWVLCRIFYKLRPSQSMDDDEGLISHPLLEFTLPTDLPPGFRFFPTDKELILHYLRNRATMASGPTSIIAEVDIYKFEPWDLPGKATFGEREWYFFCHRERKYPTQCVTNRATSSGYWKATGKDRMITLSAADDKILGFRKTLVFYTGRAPRSQVTNWVMHEYRLADDTLMSTINSTKGSSSCTRDEWLLCRIFMKTNKLQPSPFMDDDGLNQLQRSPHPWSISPPWNPKAMGSPIDLEQGNIFMTTFEQLLEERNKKHDEEDLQAVLESYAVDRRGTVTKIKDVTFSSTFTDASDKVQSDVNEGQLNFEEMQIDKQSFPVNTIDL